MSGSTSFSDPQDPLPNERSVWLALRRRGATGPEGTGLCFIEDDMPRRNQWLGARRAMLWTRKHLYYRRLKMPFRLVRSLGALLAVPYPRFWLKPAVSHYIDQKFRRALVTDKVGFLADNPLMWDDPPLLVAQEPIASDGQVWVMALWDSHGTPAILWYSTESVHATSHPLANVLDYAVADVGRRLGLARWMTFMEFCTQGGSATFLDLNPRLPGDDDWHELVWQHLSGQSLGEAVADLLLEDCLPARVRSERVVLESEWDGQPLATNQRKWETSDGYKQQPVLTFT